MLVLDYDVAEHLFHHFYGLGANYEGYMGKFIAGNPFYYSINELAIESLRHDLRSRNHQNILQAVIYSERKEVVPIEETLHQRFLKISVRDIEKLIDHYSQKKMVDATEINGYRIATDTPIVSLISILVLMNGEYSRSALEQWLLRQNNWYLFFGGFVYACEDYHGGYSEDSRQRISFSPSKNEQGIITKVDTTLDLTSQDVVPSKDQIIQSAITAAQEVVRDGRRLKW